jgi:glycosyltransferase involved in cell wall biosynthesis
MRSTKNHPLISVIIPVFNGNGYLPAAIQSILSQTYRHLEVIAIDDGSTDNSFEILKRFAKIDSRMRIYRNAKNLNIANTLNRGIKLAKGQYIARMDADDVALPHRIERQIRYLKLHPEIVIVGGQVRTIDTEGRALGRKLFPTSNKQIRESLYTSNPIQHPTAIINRALLPKNFSWYNPALPPAEDYDLFFRLGKYGNYHNLSCFVLQYRQYLGSSTFKNPLNTFNVTKKVRHLAVSKYGYIPSVRAKLVHSLQVAIVSLIPTFLIYPLYVLVRGIRSPLQLLADYLAEMKYLPNPTPTVDKLSV